MFWDYFREFRRRPKELADVLPWATLVDKDVMLCKDESFLSTWRLDALDLGRMTAYEQGHLMERLNLGWKRLEYGWGVWLDVVRRPATLPALSPLPHPMGQIIEQDHRRMIEGTLWDDMTYLSLWRGSPTPVDELAQRLLAVAQTSQTHMTLETFRDACAAVLDVVKGGTRALVPLTDDAWMTYLHGIISDHWQPVHTPAFPTGIDYVLADCDLLCGWYPKLCSGPDTGDFLRLVSVKGFPSSLWASMLSAMQRLPFGYRLVVRWLPQNMETMRRQLTRRQQKLVGKSYGIREAAFEWLTKHESRIKDRYIEHQADDTDVARFEMLKDDVGFGDLSLTVVIADPVAEQADAHVREVERVLRTVGLITVREWIGAVGAWLGTLPGLPLANPRRFRLSTLNALHLSPLTTPWRGKPHLPAVNLPALTLARTEHSMPFWVGLHTGRLQHTLVSGPSDSGKSTWMRFLAAQYFRYHEQGGPQLFWMDWKRSARLFILCMGGKYYDLGNDQVNFQPLRDIDDPMERAGAYTWLLDRAKEKGDGFTLTQGMERHLQDVLDALAVAPKAKRTLTELLYASSAKSAYLQQHAKPTAINFSTGGRDYSERNQRLTEQAAIRSVIQPFTKGGIYGHLFDADHDDITDGNIQGFEHEALAAKAPQLMVACASHIWRRLYPRFTGVPTLIPIDEAGEQLKYEVVRKWVDTGLRMLREKNVGLMLATQNHRDFVDSVIGPMLRTNCLTMFLLPNPNAIADDTRPSYEALGLSEREIREWIAAGQPNRDLYMVCPEGRRQIQVPMSPVAHTVCALSNPTVHEQIDLLLAEVGPEAFPGEWLRRHGHAAEADTWKRLVSRKES